ncbi:hypothetical protein EIP91_007960 [Steccherinum ochraceum]|uniref:Uncharacterized protein n=1 Tax=Steccherinum ochraceum TaxID=92696 RepID=A0A4R0R3P2_9APHY|nr:hypothetical protein EIP91_007960 [Steccherinum ochraceum]
MGHWHHHGRGGPSRFVWFMIGAFSATWFLKHKYTHNGRIRCSRPEISADSYAVPPTYPYYPAPRPAIPVSASAAVSASPTVPVVAVAEEQPAQTEVKAPTPTKERRWSPWGHSHSPPPPPPPPPPAPPVDHRWDDEMVQKNWEEERAKQWEQQQQKMQTVGRQAQDTFTDFSEATLDTILTTVEGMKAKLAEHRANRERQIREWQTWREEQIRQLDEWKKQQAQAPAGSQPPLPPFPTRPSSA